MGTEVTAGTLATIEMKAPLAHNGLGLHHNNDTGYQCCICYYSQGDVSPQLLSAVVINEPMC